jgi:GSH-dependent disulfide-bond oxidoreductase
MTNPIDLYFWPTPNGLKITIALEEMGLPYAMHPVNIMKGEQFGEAFLKIGPNGKMPAIVDPEGPDGTPISIFESGAILQYLGRKTGQFYPVDERGRVEVDQWLFWQMAALGPMTGQAGHFVTFAKEKVPYAIDRYTTEVKRLYGVMDRRLADRDYLAGDYSIADIACWPWLMPAPMLGIDLADYPNLKSWHERVGARPKVMTGSVVGVHLRPPLPPKPERLA